jgi:hypothetical protein
VRLVADAGTWDDRVVMGRIRRLALVALMILATLVAPIAVPIRLVRLQRRREARRTEFVVRDRGASALRLPETV